MAAAASTETVDAEEEDQSIPEWVAPEVAAELEAFREPAEEEEDTDDEGLEGLHEAFEQVVSLVDDRTVGIVEE